MWHQGHIDGLFERLNENMIVFEDVNPDRVYLMGYSAGGDGVYQLAPRMADRWAAAAMMAGHPNETLPLGLRNIAFTLHVGELDSAYNRNNVACQWQEKLTELRRADPIRDSPFGFTPRVVWRPLSHLPQLQRCIQPTKRHT